MINANSPGNHGTGSVPISNAGNLAASIGSPIGQGYYFKGDSLPMETPPNNTNNNLNIVGSPGNMIPGDSFGNNGMIMFQQNQNQHQNAQNNQNSRNQQNTGFYYNN